MNILITNDDGINAPALQILKNKLSEFGRIVVVAPETPKNAIANAITLHKPVRIQELEKDVYTVSGTPVDCARVGIIKILDENVDLVVSGINKGANLGDDINYSGTVAAAREASLLGIKSLSSSLVYGKHMNFQQAADITCKIVATMIEKELPHREFLNLNIPDLPEGKVKGIKVCRTGIRIYDKNITDKKDPIGRDYYWILGEKLEYVKDEGTDFDAISKGYASLTAISMDYTQYNTNETIKNWNLD